MLDLFGDVVVTFDDVEIWLDSIPNLSDKISRRRWYLENYDVCRKIKSSKLDGSFTELINAPERPAEAIASALAFPVRYR